MYRIEYNYIGRPISSVYPYVCVVYPNKYDALLDIVVCEIDGLNRTKNDLLSLTRFLDRKKRRDVPFE